MYKLAVFDLDGTLLNSSHKVSDLTLDAINILKQNKVKIILATGRPNTAVKDIVNLLDIDDYIITCNGAVIGHPYKEKHIYQDIIPQNSVLKLLEMCEINNNQYLAYCNEGIISKDNERLRFLKKHNEMLKEDEKANFIYSDNIYEIANNYKINKILIIEKDKIEYKKLQEIIISIDSIQITQSSETFLDVGPIKNSKGIALKRLCEHMNIELNEVIAFGDQYNDISMLEIAGFSVAMGNAKDDVKRVVDYVTKTNDDEGIFHVITKILEF